MMRWPPVHLALPRSARALVETEIGALKISAAYGSLVRATLTLPCGCRWDGAAMHSGVSAIVALVDTIEALPLPGHDYR